MTRSRNEKAPDIAGWCAVMRKHATEHCRSRTWSITLGVALAAMMSMPGPADGQVLFEAPTSVNVGINYQPSLATDGAGNYVLVWYHLPDDYQSPSAAPPAIFVARSADNGATWSMPATLGVANSGPQVATDRAGTWVTVWEGAAGLVVARSTDNGQTWTAPVTLGASQGPAQVATDGVGHWVVMWSAIGSRSNPLLQTPSAPGDILIAHSADNGVTWTDPTPLDASGAAKGSNGHVATDRAGAWVAVWDTAPYGPFAGPNVGDVWFARSTDAGATWTIPALLSADPGTVKDDMPRLATDAKGNWIVAWRAIHLSQSDLPVMTDLDILAVRSSDNGLTWTTPAWLNTTAATDRIDQQDDSPSLATDGSGVWLATWDWYEIVDGQMHLHALVAQSTDNGTSWTPPALINPNQDFVTNMEQEPDVASDGAGHWVVAWALDSPNTMIAARGSTCGNGIVEFGKQCDDGNRIDGDGCSSSCQSEMLAGDQLVLIAGTGSQMQLVSRDPAIALGRGNLSGDDPVLHGATVRVFTTAGDGFDASYVLPAANWQYLGHAGANRGYRYRRRSGLIATASVTVGQLVKVTLKDSQLTRLLGQNPNPVHVVLTMGTRTYQLSFGGTVTFHPQRLYRGRHAPAPSVNR
jgi:cysteine-rich repeat protein